MESNNINAPKLNPVLKHFFFSSFKSKKEFKDLRKIHGDIIHLAIIMKPEKSILRVSFGEIKKEKIDGKQIITETIKHKEETPFTETEINQFLKMLGIDKSKVYESKSIFILMEFTSKVISFQQIKRTGDKINFTL